MDVLVAGASGALGQPLLRQLVARGHTVHGLTRTPANAEAITRLGARPVVADAMDREALLAATRDLRLDAVVHALTALKKLPARYRDMAQTNALRTEGMANLLAVARATGARRVVAESMHVGYGLGDWGSQVITEETPFAPPGRTPGLEQVNAAFRALESQLRDAEGITGVAMRYGAFYGPGATESTVAMMRRRLVPLVGDGDGVMHWIHMEDAASATVAALEHASPSPAYNVVDDEPVSWRDFVGRLAEACGTPKPMRLPRAVVTVAAPYAVLFMTTRLRVSNARAKRELGWAPAYPTYREGLAQFGRAAGFATA